jgi:Cu/Ag efflux protein CusF
MSKYVVRSVLAGTVAALALAFSLPARGEETEKAPKPSKHQYTGVIESLDAAAKTLTIKKKDGDVKSFTCGEKCKFTMNDKESVALADFKAGEKVTAFYTEEDGKNMLHKLTTPKQKKEREQSEDR